jgi:hypothetical protein
MAPTPSVKISKTFLYRGQTQVFSNRYHFNGGTPADATHWNTLFDNIVNAEKALYPSGMTIIGAVGYAAGSDLPVASKAYTTAGTASFVGGVDVPGDTAALLRYATTARSVKNHPIYLFNYFHAMPAQSGGSADIMSTAARTALLAYGQAWITGFSDGSLTCVRAGPNGATATSRTVPTYLTHRDFPR